jgi:hypothetical protein
LVAQSRPLLDQNLHPPCELKIYTEKRFVIGTEQQRKGARGKRRDEEKATLMMLVGRMLSGSIPAALSCHLRSG